MAATPATPPIGNSFERLVRKGWKLVLISLAVAIYWIATSAYDGAMERARTAVPQEVWTIAYFSVKNGEKLAGPYTLSSFHKDRRGAISWRYVDPRVGLTTADGEWEGGKYSQHWETQEGSGRLFLKERSPTLLRGTTWRENENGGDREPDNEIIIKRIQ